MTNGPSTYVGQAPTAIPLIDQYPFTVFPGTSQKAAGLRGPFGVRNLSTTATVWLADNPAVSDGKGTPLYPGTGLIWTGSQQTAALYVALGIDAQSVAAGTCTITIGDPARDWQPNPVAIATAVLNSGVIVVEKETTLFPAQLNAAAVDNSANLDVSTKQSIYVRMLYVAGSGSIVFNWFDSSGTVGLGQDAYQWVSGDSVNCTLHIPVVGAILQVAWNWSQANGFNLLVIGSQRLVPREHQRLIDRELGGGSQSLATLAQMTVTPNYRYDGPVIIAASIGATAVPNEGFEIVVTDRVNAQNFARYMVPVVALTGHTFAVITERFVAPRNSWQVVLTNRTTTTQTATVVLTAAPEGT